MRPYDLNVARNGHSESCAEHGGGDCTCGCEGRCPECGALNTFAHGHDDSCPKLREFYAHSAGPEAPGGAQ